VKRASLIALLVLVLAPVAHAQDDDGVYPTDDFSAHRFYMAPGPGNFLTVEGANVGEDLSPSFGVTLGYMHRPFAADDVLWYVDCTQGITPSSPCSSAPDPTVETDMLGPLLTLQLYGSFTFLERIQIAANLPFVLYGSGEGLAFTEGTGREIRSRTAAPGGEVGGLSDPRISAKVRILDPDHEGNGVMMAASAFIQIPVGHYIFPGAFIGDPAPQGGINAIGGFRFEEFRLALNLGFIFRGEAENVRSEVGPEFTYGVAAAYRFHPVAEVIVEYSGYTSFGARFDSEAPMGLRAAINFHAGEFTFHLGGSVGLAYGIGQEVFGVFGGMQFALEPDPDTDNDGLTDSNDGCPGDAEDMDGWEDEDGCPELDNDGDDIPDADDPCPDEAEDLDDYEDEDGCPEPDNDGDGIDDGYDSCPNTPEDMDGDRDTDGCPDADADQDGLEDTEDQCPNEPEDFDGFADEDGCPEEDFDEDTVPDTEDECPEEPEDLDGYEDSDGCPEEESGGRRRLQRAR